MELEGLEGLEGEQNPTYACYNRLCSLTNPYKKKTWNARFQ